MHEENYSKGTAFAIFAGMKQFIIAVFSRNPREVDRYIRENFPDWCILMSSARGAYSYCDWYRGACSVYSVCHAVSADDIRDGILSLFDRVERKYARLAVTEASGLAGWLEQRTWDWLGRAQSSAELSNIENPTLVQIFEHGGFSRELSKCYSVADIDRLLGDYRGRPEHDMANCRARMIAWLQERLQLLNNR